jgi:uncharacterized repeat protein (TIGR02543 family)
MSPFRHAAADGAEPSRRPLLGALAVLIVGALLTVPARATVVFSAFGDVPYSSGEVTDLQQNVANHNLYSPSAFLVHLGDINSGSEQCQETRYQTVANILKTSQVPVFIVPGDNEWVNCSIASQGWAWWEKYLLGIDQSFCGIWPVDEQAVLPENFSFMLDGVLFLGLTYVAGTPSSVTQKDADWVNAQFAAHGSAARAAVLMAQKEPGGALFSAVKANGHAFAKPVLYIHGDGHSWLVDSSFFGEPNMLRVQVDRGTLAHPPVQVTVTSAGQFVFNRNPWPSGTLQIVRPPCGGGSPTLSVEDLFVAEGQNAVFNVNLTGATGSAVSVNYSTQDQTARAGEDYQAKSGSLSFSGTATQRQITVATTQDTAPESGESFVVNLANASGAAIGKAQGAAVILDDDSGAPPTGGVPVLRETLTGTSTGSSAVSTSAPVVAASGDLYLAAVAFKPNLGVASVSGLGLPWTLVRQQCAGRAQTGMALYRAQGIPTASGIVTASFSTAPSNAVISVARYSGVIGGGGIGSVGSANTNGVSGACSGGVDAAAYAFDLASGAPNSLVFVAAAMRNTDHQPGAGFTERAETFAGSSGSMAGASLADRLLGLPATLSVNGTFSGTVDWAVVAAEVRAAGVILAVTSTGGGSVTLSPPGGQYASGTSVTLTAVPSAGYTFAGWSGDLAGTANPATLVMDASKTVTAAFLPQYTITVGPTTGGSVTLSPPGGVYPSGTQVTLTAVPAVGYVFSSWGGNLSGTTNPQTLLVDANKSVTASFTTPSTPVANFGASPTSGPAPLVVAFSDLSTGSPTSWAWTFGDGATSTLRNPSHSYSAAGSFDVRLTATNANGPNSLTRLTLIQVSATARPTADFSGTPLSGAAPLAVAFSDLSTGSPTSWAWTFGDGATSTLRNPSHSYSAAGAYGVALTASNAAGSNTKTRTGYVNVGTGAPTQSFVPVADARISAVSPTSNYPTEITLRAKLDSYESYLRFDVSALAGLGVVSAKLRLFVTDASDDGGSAYAVANSWTETGITWSNAPALPGTPLASVGAVVANQSVEFDVTNAVPSGGSVSFAIASGSTNSVYFSSREGTAPPQLVVQTGPPIAPVADFTGTPVSGSAPLQVAFSDLSTGGPTSWLWSFGDSTTSTQQSPTRTYASPGTYTVSLTATNAQGATTRTRSAYVVVAQAMPSFSPTADAKVNEASPAQNYGAATDLRLKSALGGSWRSFLRFDVSGLTTPVLKATLRLHVDDASRDGGVVRGVATTWTESGITWGTAPVLDAPPIASLGAVATGAWVEVDVTGTVVGNGSYAFGLANADTDSAYYGSRESANPPQLVIQVAP